VSVGLEEISRLTGRELSGTLLKPQTSHGAQRMELTIARPPKPDIRQRMLLAVIVVYDGSEQRVSLNGSQIARWVDEPTSTVHNYLQAMLQEGLIEQAGNGWLPTAQGRAFYQHSLAFGKSGR
jgi:hypothetical protein